MKINHIILLLFPFFYIQAGEPQKIQLPENPSHDSFANRFCVLRTGRVFDK